MGPHLPLWEASARILLAMLLAGIVGAERESRDQEAGLRTHMLVGVGAALFVVVGNFSWRELDFGNASGVVLDPSRVVAYVITGIGFLGAGAIIKHGVNVRGLTTAASLWVVAAVGVASGSGDYELAAIATAAVLLSLWPVRWIAQATGLRARGTHRVDIVLASDALVAQALAELERSGLGIESVRVSEQAQERRLELVVRGPNGVARDALDAPGLRPLVREASLRG